MIGIAGWMIMIPWSDFVEIQRDVNRLKITTADKKGLENDPRQTVASAGLKNGDELVWKDLGPQICAWSVVPVIVPMDPLTSSIFYHATLCSLEARCK